MGKSKFIMISPNGKEEKIEAESVVFATFDWNSGSISGACGMFGKKVDVIGYEMVITEAIREHLNTVCNGNNLMIGVALERISKQLMDESERRIEQHNSAPSNGEAIDAIFQILDIKEDD